MLDSIINPVLDALGQGGTTTTRRRKKSTRARRTYVMTAPRARSKRKVSRGRKTSTRRPRRY